MVKIGSTKTKMGKKADGFIKQRIINIKSIQSDGANNLFDLRFLVKI